MVKTSIRWAEVKFPWDHLSQAEKDKLWKETQKGPKHSRDAFLRIIDRCQTCPEHEKYCAVLTMYRMKGKTADYCCEPRHDTKIIESVKNTSLDKW